MGSFVPSEEPQHAVKENGASGVVDELRHLWRRCDSCTVLAQPPARLPVPRWRGVWPPTPGGAPPRRDIQRTQGTSCRTVREHPDDSSPEAGDVM
jgi:hypothetical protein